MAKSINPEPLKVFKSEVLEQPNIRHGFFSRHGGHSTGIYQSLNCGNGSEDKARNVSRNQCKVANYLGVDPANLLTLYQKHSPFAIHVQRPWPKSGRPEADAMVTTRPGLAIGVLTADCAPVLLLDSDKSIVGVAHAGWQGAISGVIGATLDLMLSCGASTSGINAVIGPCIGQPNYQVGPEFRDRFQKEYVEADAFFQPTLDASKPDHWQFDLRAFVERQLTNAGLASVTSIDLCTYGDSDNFYSYRRATHLGEPDYGRNISAIAVIHD